MDPDWFLPHILSMLAGGEVPYAFRGASPATQEFFRSRIAWVDQLTGLRFYESPAPLLTITQAPVIPGGSDGLANNENGGLQVYVTRDPIDNRAQFVAVHELGHVLGLAHPYGDSLHLTATNRVTIMGGRLRGFETYRTTFSPLDIAHLQQAHGVQTLGPATEGPDVIIGGPGPQRLRGRGGADWLMGGGGQDVFVIERPTTLMGWDVIEDFSRRDSLRLRSLSLKGISMERQGDDVRILRNGQTIALAPDAPSLTMEQIS